MEQERSFSQDLQVYIDGLCFPIKVRMRQSSEIDIFKATMH
jgi:hypothetical protein